MGALLSFDLFLARLEREETKAHAAGLVAEGLALLARGDNAAAVKKLEDAVAEERGNREYQRRLAEAELAAGRPGDAELVLGELLQGDPTDGASNLWMGRVLVRQGRWAEGISYFHRAVYGHWEKDVTAQRLAVRFELIDLLAGLRMKEDLLAELLPVQDSGSTVAERFRIGQLFLSADSPARAEQVFRGILREEPANGEALAGVGQAEFARGDYRAARRDLTAAKRSGAMNPAALRLLGTVEDLFAMDPTLRGLGPGEKFRRSRELLRRTAELAPGCAGLQSLTDEARQRLAAKVRAGRELEAAEGDLDLAERLWQGLKRECKSGSTPGSTPDVPLGIVLGRLGQ